MTVADDEDQVTWNHVTWGDLGQSGGKSGPGPKMDSVGGAFLIVVSLLGFFPFFSFSSNTFSLSLLLTFTLSRSFLLLHLPLSLPLSFISTLSRPSLHWVRVPSSPNPLSLTIYIHFSPSTF